MVWVRIVLCVVLLTGLPAMASAQAASGAGSAQPAAAASPPVKTSLNTLVALLAHTPNAPTTLSFAKFRVRNALDKLVQLSAAWPAESPADYRSNLDTSVRTFDDCWPRRTLRI